jgi:hypothetical protein
MEQLFERRYRRDGLAPAEAVQLFINAVEFTGNVDSAERCEPCTATASSRRASVRGPRPRHEGKRGRHMLLLRSDRRVRPGHADVDAVGHGLGLLFSA